MRRIWLLAIVLISIQAHAEVVKCSQLGQVVTRPAWLSVPNSRIVLNPNAPMPLPASWDLCSSLPMNPAYFVGEHPAKFPGLTAWYWQPVAVPGGPPTTGRSLELTNPSLWETDNLAVTPVQEGIKLTVGKAQTWGIYTCEVEVDLDKSPRLSVQVPQVDGTWCIKVNSGKEPSDTVVMEGAGPGGFAVDIPEMTGWHGTKTFKLRLFACGKPGSSVTYSDVRFVENRLCEGAITSTSTTWYPHQVVTAATQPDSGVEAEATTTFIDESTIAQRLRLVKVRQGSGMPALAGQIPPNAEATWDAKHRAVIIKGPNYHIAICAGPGGRWLGAAPSLWETWNLGAPDGSPQRVWAIIFDDPKPGAQIVVVARFAPTSQVSEQTAIRARTFADPRAFDTALKAREAAWDKLLAQVPRPLDTQVHLLKRDMVTADAIRRTYYRAWAFLLSNIIPPMPENGFRYPQVGCGKPSLWEEGHPRAYNSAQWESIIAMQFVAWADPKAAWDAYEGMLSLVDKDGSMGGECLPAHHANTAWVLYSLTGDTDHLRRCYPAMKRWLLWKVENPRWIIGKHDPGPQGKSAEFLSHALMDMTYARRIAHVLGMPEEELFWTEQIEKHGLDYRTWFWETPGGIPYFSYNTDTGKRSGPGEMWTLQALGLPQDILGEPQRDSLLKHLRGNWHEDMPFIIWNSSRYPNYVPAMRGMWQYGTPVESAKMAEAAVSAVTNAGDFGEVYSERFPVQVGGVRPSVFGAENIIDSLLWHNGVLITDGLPVLAHMPNALGVENLRWKAGILNVRYTGETVQLSGTALQHLRMPPGFTAHANAWTGPLPVGKQIALEER